MSNCANTDNVQEIKRAQTNVGGKMLIATYQALFLPSEEDPKSDDATTLLSIMLECVETPIFSSSKSIPSFASIFQILVIQLFDSQ